jgi:hypothetical protein
LAQLGREGDKPAIVIANIRFEWYLEGKRHRAGDHPAIIDEDHRAWYKNGVLHREGDKPAVIHGVIQEWYKNDKRDREGDLPAFINGNYSA